MDKSIFPDVRRPDTFYHLPMGDFLMEQLPFVIYLINLMLVLIMRFILWAYATRKYSLVIAILTLVAGSRTVSTSSTIFRVYERGNSGSSCGL